MRSYHYVDTPSCWLWDTVDAIKEEKEYPYCNELLHWLKRIGWREYERRVKRRKALRIFMVWRYPHYVHVVLKRLGVVK